MKPTVIAFVTAACLAGPRTAAAQAPPTGPLVLQLPATARTAALGDAWVAGRDQDVLFYNPAQIIGARQGFDVSFIVPSRDAMQTTLGSVYAAGKWSLTFGWGVRLLNFSASPAAAYPYSPDVLLGNGTAKASSSAVVVGGAFVYKGFRIGAAGKYVSDRVAMPPGFIGESPVSHGAMLVDLGVSRPLFRGTAAASVQNLGPDTLDDGGTIRIPRQGLFGWSMSRGAGPLDIGFAGQVLVRDGWTSPAAGVEIGYSWIDGYYIAARAGVRRPDSDLGQPISLGASFTADRLTVEYGVQFFEGGRASNGVTVRWR